MGKRYPPRLFVKSQTRTTASDTPPFTVGAEFIWATRLQELIFLCIEGMPFVKSEGSTLLNCVLCL